MDKVMFTKFDTSILHYIIRNNGATIRDLSKYTGKNKVSVSKSLNKLMKMGLIHKKVINRKNVIYQLNDKDNYYVINGTIIIFKDKEVLVINCPYYSECECKNNKDGCLLLEKLKNMFNI